MNDTHRDDVIRRALTPADHVHLPPGLVEEVGRMVSVTAQDRPGRGAGVPHVRRMLGPSPAVLLLLLLLGTIAGLAIGAALLRSFEPHIPSDAITNRGDASHVAILAGPGPVGTPVIAWDVPMGRELLSFTMPLVVDGTVYTVHAKGGATATDLGSGEARWQVELGADVMGTPHVADGLLIVAGLDGVVRALELRDGAERWRTDLATPLSVAIAGWADVVLLSTEEGEIHALDVSSGARRWSVAVGGPVMTAPAIAAGVAYAVSADGHVVAFSTEDGSVSWRHRLEGAISTPVVRDGVLYLAIGAEDGSRPSEVVALADDPSAAERGPRELWRWQAPTDEIRYVASVADDLVYVTSRGSGVHAIDRRSGAGRLLLPTQGGVGPMAMVVGDDLYVASADGTVHAADRRSGELRWSIPVPGEPTSPVVVDGRVIVGTGLGRLLSIVGD